ncbi:hypothetical protein [Brevibacterium casei]|uniref:hypothetical protein n=1 Tax=Brevibacterium casei TaxID=33889 RepID=UPI00223C0E0B|nr:hypothetical protein [Brevibacterium casei]MCT1549652.1 hypothetical protein [Brevibacterium casei]MCT1559189.1 hypothetical protein [Brevibacterium casei]MCT2207617.1 hypothetical protein [Brevibacterium casei]
MTELRAPEDMTLAELEAELAGPIDRDREEAVSASYYARMDDLRALTIRAVTEFLEGLSQDDFDTLVRPVLDDDEYGAEDRAVMREYAVRAAVTVLDADELLAERKRQEREQVRAGERQAQAEHDREVIRRALGPRQGE